MYPDKRFLHNIGPSHGRAEYAMRLENKQRVLKVCSGRPLENVKNQPSNLNPKFNATQYEEHIELFTDHVPTRYLSWGGGLKGMSCLGRGVGHLVGYGRGEGEGVTK